APCRHLLRASLFICGGTSPPVIYALSLHDALPISAERRCRCPSSWHVRCSGGSSSSGCFTRRRARSTSSSIPAPWRESGSSRRRSEEHTSELQSRGHLVCRLLLEKKK